MIESVETGELFPVEILPATPTDFRLLEVGWLFSWEQEAKTSEVFKLVQVRVPDSILGLLSILRREGFIEVLLLENSPSNVGQGKVYKGIAGCLLAFAADLSVKRGDGGYMRLTAKTELIDHYIREYGFVRLGHSQNMILLPAAAVRLIATFSEEV